MNSIHQSQLQRVWFGAALILATMLATVLVVSPAIASTAVNVSALSPWTNTGIDVAGTDVIELRASGTIKIAGSDPGKTPIGDASCIAGATWVAPGLPCWSLIGRIGNGDAFPVGEFEVVAPASSGRLHLGVNDETGFFGDNSGSWSATVAVTKDVVPSSGGVSAGFEWKKNCNKDEGGSKCHAGQDIDGADRDPVYAMRPGTVIRARCDKQGFGWFVVIDHGRVGSGDRLFGLYAHMGKGDGKRTKDDCDLTSYLSVAAGDTVTSGEMIGRQGNSGQTKASKEGDGVHLHFSLMIAQQYSLGDGVFNPVRCIGAGPWVGGTSIARPNCD